MPPSTADGYFSTITVVIVFNLKFLLLFRNNMLRQWYDTESLSLCYYTAGENKDFLIR